MPMTTKKLIGCLKYVRRNVAVLQLYDSGELHENSNSLERVAEVLILYVFLDTSAGTPILINTIGT